MTAGGWAQVVCKTCGAPARVLFDGDEIVRVLAPCGHVGLPEKEEKVGDKLEADMGRVYGDLPAEDYPRGERVAKTVWKWPVKVTDVADIWMPAAARILAVQPQAGAAPEGDEALCVWALVDGSRATETRRLWIVGTGHPIPEDAVGKEHLGTVQLMGGAFVCHVFGDRE